MPPAKPRANAPKPAPAVTTWPFGRLNYIIFGAALVVLVLGYVLLANNSITLAPLLLVVGYVILLPLAILIKDKGKSESAPTDPPAR